MTIDKTVAKETRYIAVWVLAFSVLMQVVFVLIGDWDYTVLLGNLLGAATAVGNFLLMGLTVQKAVAEEPKDAARRIRMSQSVSAGRDATPNLCQITLMEMQAVAYVVQTQRMAQLGIYHGHNMTRLRKGSRLYFMLDL